MAVHISTGIYGQVFGQPPYIGSNDSDSFTRLVEWSSPVVMSFPTAGTVFHPVSPGQQVGNSSNYIYSVIEVQATGLTTNPQSTKYASNASVATLASAAS